MKCCSVKASYKRIQLASDIPLSSGVNISSNIYEISSDNAKKHDIGEMNETTVACAFESEDIWETGENELEQIGQDVEQIGQEDSNTSNNSCYNGSVCFVAFEIETRLLKAKGCLFCKKVLQENKRVENQQCVGQNIPCESTFTICKLADVAITRFIENVKDNLNDTVISFVLKRINFCELYPNFFELEHDDHEDHKHFLVRFIINEYIHLKCTFISKRKNLDMHVKYFRHMYRKKIQRAGQ